jgi:hypothetical protein
MPDRDQCRRATPAPADDPVARLREPEECDVRGLPDFLRMWQLCARAACRRGRRCHEEFECLAVREVFMPRAVFAWFDAMATAMNEGKDLGDAYEATRSLAPAAIGWRAALRAAEACAARDRRRGDGRE